MAFNYGKMNRLGLCLMQKAKQKLSGGDKKSVIRAGRPIAANKGEVDLRLLDAATQLFLNRGFEATSCEQIATLAGAGKGSLYARYANKEELFTAVVRRSVEASLRPSNDSFSELPLMDRLRIVGLDILHHSLQADAVAMMRMVIATATQFPELAQLADRIGWEGGVERVAEVISARAKRGSLPRARPAAAWFISLTFAPQQMRALFGESSHSLQVGARVRVEEAIKMLARSGWLDGWE
jgi:AcrR family transcriptional regulator